MGKKKRKTNKNINRSVPLGEEKKEQKGEGLKEGLDFLFWGDNPLLIEPLSFGVLLKRILLIIDNLLAVCFVILSFMLLLYYGKEMDWQGAMNAAEDYIYGHPVLMSFFFIFSIPFFWRPIKHTKLMPLSYYATDLVLLMFALFWVFNMFFVLVGLEYRGTFDRDEFPYWVSCMRFTLILFLFCYRRVFLTFVSRKNTIRSLWRRITKKTYENKENGNGVESQSEHSTLWDDFKFFVFGSKKQGAPAESLTYKLTPRRISIILDNLIAPAVCYYFSVWMRRLYYGVDCSFGAVVNDIFYDKDYGNIIILYLVMLFLFWRPLWYNDKKPYWTNFKQSGCYVLIALTSAFFIFFVWRDYANLIDAGRMQEFTSYNRQRGIFHFEHYVPLWIDIIRVIGIVSLFWVRRFLLQDVEVSFKGQNQSSSES